MRKPKAKATVHLASAETPKTGQSGESVALCSPSAGIVAREARHPRPGQAVYNGLFDDKLEAEILEHIANGCTWSDSARLCGISRESSLNWRNRGAAYLENPDEHPQDARYGLFEQRIEEAELRCKAAVIKKLLECDDWRSWRFWLINRAGGEWKSEHVKSEISGPDGGPIPMSNAFAVTVQLSGDPEPNWSVVDHTNEPHRESAQLPDPFAIPPAREGEKKRQ